MTIGTDTELLSTSMTPSDVVILEKLADGALSMQTLRVQIAVFFGSATFVSLGIAFGQKNAALIVLTGLFLLVFIPVDATVRTLASRLLLAATELLLKNDPGPQEKYLPLAFMFGGPPPALMQRILNEGKFGKREKLTWLYPYMHPSPVGVFLPLVGGITLVLLGILLIQVGGWSVV